MRRIIAAILALAALMGLGAVFSPAALADGDPASDVLVYDSVFNPPDSGATPAQYGQLRALVEYVSRHGYPLKVALIGSSADLGTVTQLWGNPPDYGIYLGKELSLVFQGRLLVVMPQGYGLRDPVTQKHIPAGDTKAMSGLNAPGSDLVGGARLVIQRLATDNGIALPKTLSYSTPKASPASSSGVPLIGFIVGLIAVAGAWGLSVWTRPLQRRAAA